VGGVVGFIFASSKETADNSKDTSAGVAKEKEKERELEPASGGRGRGVRNGKKDRSQQGIDDQVEDISKNQANARKVGQGNAINSIKKSLKNQDQKNSNIKSWKDIEQQ